MKILGWIKLLFQFLGLVKEAEELAAGKPEEEPGVTKASSGPPRDPTDKQDKFHLNQ